MHTCNHIYAPVDIVIIKYPKLPNLKYVLRLCNCVNQFVVYKFSQATNVDATLSYVADNLNTITSLK